MGSFTIVYTTFLPKHLGLVLKSIDLLHKYFGVATNIFKSFTQSQGSALGRQRRGRVPRLVDALLLPAGWRLSSGSPICSDCRAKTQRSI